MSEWLDRSAALAALKVRPQTLYAYVSRGRIGMRPEQIELIVHDEQTDRKESA